MVVGAPSTRFLLRRNDKIGAALELSWVVQFTP
jgi:hypothetical protein